MRSSTWPAGLAAAALTVSGLAVGTGAAAQAAANGQAHRRTTHSPDSATPDYRPACAAAQSRTEPPSPYSVGTKAPREGGLVASHIRPSRGSA